MASDRGDCAAIHNYAYIHENGLGCPSDRQEAFRYYKMSADLGNYNAMKKVEQLQNQDDCLIA